MQALDLVINCSMNYPLFESFPHKLTVRTSFLRFNLFCCLLAILKNLTLFSFQGAASGLFQNQMSTFESLQVLKSNFKRDQSFLYLLSCSQESKWWRLAGSNRWPPACKAGALPAELNLHISLPSLSLVGGPKWTRTTDLPLIRRTL